MCVHRLIPILLLCISPVSAAQTAPVPATESAASTPLAKPKKVASAPKPPEVKNRFGLIEGWKGEASATGSKTTGNTDTTDVGIGLKLANTEGRWKHKFKGNFDYGRNKGVKNKQRLRLSYQLDRQINERIYSFGNADYYEDDFGAFEQGYYIGGGMGYKFLLPEPAAWDLEAGGGYRYQDPQGDNKEIKRELGLRLASDFDYDFNDKVSAYNNTEMTYSGSDTYIWNEVGLTSQLMGNLAARASFRVDNHSAVPIGREKTDTITRVGVVYKIK